MKLRTRFWILGLLVLSSAFCGAETRTITHNFQSMYDAGTLSVNTPTNTIGTTDEVIYTCSGGAEIWKSGDSGNRLAIFLDNSGAQVVTTAIQNLDSLHFQFSPSSSVDFSVAISKDEISWIDVPVAQPIPGIGTAKLPSAGDYYLRIRRGNINVYIKQIKYYYIDLSDCPNCFIYKP